MDASAFVKVIHQNHDYGHSGRPYPSMGGCRGQAGRTATRSLVPLSLDLSRDVHVDAGRVR